MHLKLKISTFLYAINLVFLFGTGLVFQFSSEFLGFHSDVIQTKWQQLEPMTQVLYLGMMRTEAAGFLASGVAIALLMVIPFRRCELWSCWAMSLIGLVEYCPTFLANYHVSSVSPASPPWPLILGFMMTLIIALTLGLSGMKAQAS